MNGTAEQRAGLGLLDLDANHSNAPLPLNQTVPAGKEQRL
jgi:hypothetical protein